MRQLRIETGLYVHTFLLMALVSAGTGINAETRPWGNLKPATPDVVQTENSNSGYRGKYNPWQQLAPEGDAKQQQPEEVDVWGRNNEGGKKGYEYSTRETQRKKDGYRKPETGVQGYSPYQPVPGTPIFDPYYDPYYRYDGADDRGYGQRRGNSTFPFGDSMWPGSWSFY